MEVERREESPSGYVALKGSVVVALGSGVRVPEFKSSFTAYYCRNLGQVTVVPPSAVKLSVICYPRSTAVQKY